MLLLVVGDEHETMYECKNYRLTKRDDCMIFSLNVDNAGENIAVVINGETPRRIFVMSNTGKTISTYNWKVKK